MKKALAVKWHEILMHKLAPRHPHRIHWQDSSSTLFTLLLVYKAMKYLLLMARKMRKWEQH